jgi:carboxyl-terminal processing protease
MPSRRVEVDMGRWLLAAMFVFQIDGAAVTGGVEVAARLHELIQQYFVHWEGAPRGDVERAYQEYVTRVSGATDRHAFDLATLRFIAALRNGHTQFIDDRADSRPLKFRLLEVEDRWIVVGSQTSSLPNGTIVSTIDGRPVGDVVRDLSQYVAASNDRLARTHVFSYPMLFPERIAVGLAAGSVVVVHKSVKPDAPISFPSASEGKWLVPSRIAYIRVPGFGNPVFERSAIDLVHQFDSASTLIVDVRFNGGGATPFRLIDALMNKPWRTWQATNRESREQSPAADAFGGRLFLLVNRFCGSACEDFVMPFKDTHRAVLIGETTQGSSGDPYRTDLGDGMRVTVGAVRYRFPDGRPFEGIGIEPDIPVALKIADVRSGRDTILDRALVLARAETRDASRPGSPHGRSEK